MADSKKDILDQLGNSGIEVIEKKNFTLLNDASINVDCFVDMDKAPDLSDLIFKKTTKRGTNLFVYDFVYSNGRFGFTVGAKPHESFILTYIPTNYELCMSFIDFCWIMSEGTTKESAQEHNTVVGDKMKLGDLTWCLPSKFADDLIDVVGLMNHYVLSGILEDCFLYGPIFKKAL